MKFKEEIESLLEDLKKKGYSRGKIEQDLGYSENYIDQTLSKGGNKKFLTVLKGYRDRVLQKTIQNADIPSNGDLQIAIRELAESTNRHSKIDERNSKNIERLINLLEAKVFGVHGLELPPPGTTGTRTLVDE